MDQHLSSSEEYISELLATISHEFRGPLAAIKAYTSTLQRHRDRLSSTEQAEYLQAISERIDHLEALMRRILLLAQVTQGTPPLVPMSVHIHSFLQDIVTSYKQQPIPSAVSLQTHSLHENTQENPATHIYTDPQYLRQVFVELLDNAIKYTPAGSTIAVEFHIIPPQSHREIPSTSVLEVRIQDEGPGISSEQLSMLFKRFKRGDMTLTRPVDGLGIGLTLCLHIMTLLGGTIHAESQPGQGSIFTIRLPTTNA